MAPPGVYRDDLGWGCHGPLRALNAQNEKSRDRRPGWKLRPCLGLSSAAGAALEDLLGKCADLLLAAIFFLVLGWGLFPASLARAQDQEKDGVAVEQDVLFSSGISGHGGSMSVARSSLTASIFKVPLEYDYYRYTWRNVDYFSFGNGRGAPWRQLNYLSVQPGWFGEIADGWGYFLAAELYSAFEKDVDRSFGTNLAGGFTYAFSPKLGFNVGVVYSLRRVRRQLTPIVTIDWDKDAEEGLSASIGIPESTIVYRFSPSFALYIKEEENDDAYSLSNDGGAGSASYVECIDILSGLYAEYSPAAHLRIALGLEYDADRKLKLFDSSEREVAAFSIDGAPGVVLRLRYDM